MSSDEYKVIHEAFMQNNNGTTAADTFATILPAFFTSCFVKQFVISYGLTNYYCKLYLEFFIIVLPIVLSTTIFVHLRFHLLLFCVIIFCCTHFKSIRNIRHLWSLKAQHRKEWTCISQSRAMISLITIHCILAVDFNVFPRYLAKTETYGHSLMDTGVGLFVFSNALVSSKISKYGIFKSIEQNLKTCIVLLTLGYFRTMIVNEIDYQQHVTEYGLHWNFFFTLAVTKFTATCLLHIFKEDNALINGTILMCLHEVLLFQGLSEWVFSDVPRDNFVSANREGIASCLGYVSMYLISTYVGQTVREKYYHKTEGKVLNILLCTAVSLWSISYLSDAYFGTSRCLANMGYCTYVLAIGVTIMMMFYVYELSETTVRGVDKHSKLGNYQMPIILNAINKNGLLFFLVANMVTGLVNLLFQTIYLNTFISLTIMFLHMIFCVIGIVGWENKKR